MKRAGHAPGGKGRQRFSWVLATLLTLLVFAAGLGVAAAIVLAVTETAVGAAIFAWILAVAAAIWATRFLFWCRGLRPSADEDNPPARDP